MIISSKQGILKREITVKLSPIVIISYRTAFINYCIGLKRKPGKHIFYKIFFSFPVAMYSKMRRQSKKIQ